MSDEESIGIFTGNVKRMFELQDSMKLLAAETRLRRTPLKEEIDRLQDDIKQFMNQSKIDAANYHDERIELQTVVRFGSLTKKSLKAALVHHFQNEGQAESLFESIMAFIGSKELQVLKRLKKRGGAKTSTPVPQDDDPPDLSDEDD